MGGTAMLVLTIFLAPLIALAILGGLILAGIRIWRGEPPIRRRRQQDEETRMIQEIFNGLSKMEKRIEALETILLDPERKGRDEPNE